MFCTPRLSKEDNMMRLLRVQVPEFRALKNVDISFEPEFTPQVFPLGSLNGGGKSTLLQLIFVLLSCVWDNVSQEKYLKHIIELTKDHNLTKLSNLASIIILTSHGKVELQYFSKNKKNFLEKLDKKENYYIYLHDANYCFVLISFLDIKKSQDERISMGEVINKCATEISNKIFLISPSSQPHIFLCRENNRLLFTTNSEKTYDQVLKGLKEGLPNFYTYDFNDVLTEIFRIARRKDFKERNKENPFAHTEKLENDINNLFIDGKKIVPLIIEEERHTKDEIQGVYFKLPNGTEIYPEDLSHGELKRLAIFVLIKYHDIQDSIVLMDEIENGFHPRWQRYIVDDLVEWGANNQYILATHSYEVCRNVTFEHIKELSPKLFPENQE
jgi:predicted ATPase